MRLSGAALLLLAAGVATCASPAPLPPQDAACRIQQQSDVVLRRAGNFLLLPAQLQDQDVLMLLDTGSEISTLSPATVARLGLQPDRNHGRVLIGIGGRVRTASTEASGFALAGAAPQPKRFSLGTGELLPGLVPPVAGLLGADALAGLDLDLDPRRARVRLTSVANCPQFRPWVAPGVPLARLPAGLIRVTVEVDGLPVRALLDTGARISVMTRQLAASLGVTEAMLQADPAATAIGISRAAIGLHRHRFAAISLGPAIWTDVTVAVTDASLPQADMLLGADLLGRQEVWIGQDRVWLR